MMIDTRQSRITLVLLGLVGFLLLANCLGIVSTLYLGHGTVFGLVRLFSFDQEGNIPTLYSCSALLLVSILLIIIALGHWRKQESAGLWLFLSLVFLFLSIDEISSIHEQVGPAFLEIARTVDSGIDSWLPSFYAWIIPYSALVLGVVLISFQLLSGLSKKYLLLFVAAGAIFLAGALGFEMLGGNEVAVNGRQTLAYATFYTLEELLEMLGIVLFIHALLSYVSETFGDFSIVIRK